MSPTNEQLRAEIDLNRPGNRCAVKGCPKDAEFEGWIRGGVGMFRAGVCFDHCYVTIGGEKARDKEIARINKGAQQG